ncbi:MAG: DMT family transporter [Spirochaetes bacterium]|nr:DMT family transporter [Spirochaetota bacterium]
MRNKFGLIYILITLAMIFWGMSFVWVKIVFKYIGPFTLVFIRLFFSSILLFLFSSIFGLFEKIKDKSILFSIMLLSFFEPFLYFICESFGLMLVSATIGSIIIATIPVLTPIFSFIFEKERLTFYGIIGLFISTIGVFLLIFLSKVEKISENNISIKGIILLFLAVLSAIGYLITAKKILKKNVNPITLVTYQNLFGAIYFLPLFIIFELKNLRLEIFKIDELIKNVLYLSIFPSTLAFIFYNISLREIGINRSNIFTNFIPIVTAISSFFILKENFGIIKIVSIFLIIFGVFMSQIKNKRNIYIQEY